MIQHRYSFVSTALLTLALAGCALPGLGSRPLSAAVPADDPRTTALRNPQNRDAKRDAPAPQGVPILGTEADPLPSPIGQPSALQRSTTPVQNAVVPTLASTSTPPPDTNPTPSLSATRRQTAAAATPTALFKPLATAGLFSLASPEPAPVGILPQVGFFQTGGGSGYNGADCVSRPGEVRWCSPLNGANLPQTSEFSGVACGLGSQPLNATVLLPDGASQPVHIQGEPPYCREISYSPGPNTLPGRYQVIVEQGGVSLVDTFQLVRPAHPTGTLFQGCVWLVGLSPDQPVRLLAFGLIPPGANSPGPDPTLGVWRYVAERRFSAGPDGVLWVCPDRATLDRYPKLAYLAYLPSGAPLPIGEEDRLQQFQGICAGGPSTRLAAGKPTRILAKDLPVFPDPALNERPLGTLAAGNKVTVLDGPVCPPLGPWVWKVSLENGLAGWITESDTTTYFVEPIR